MKQSENRSGVYSRNPEETGRPEKGQVKEKLREKGRRRLENRAVFSALVFSAVLAMLFVIGLLTFLRPETSEIEKRQLAAAPGRADFQELWTGSYADEFDTWYQDTYPYREKLLQANAAVSAVYGLKGEELHNVSGITGEAIPTGAVEKAPIITDTDSLPDTDAGNGSSGPDAVLLAGNATDGSADGSAASGDGGTDAAGAQGASADAGNQTGNAAESTENSSGNAGENSSGGTDNAAEGTDSGSSDGTITAVPESAGTIYIAGNRGFEIFYFADVNATSYASMINTVRSRLGAGVTLYDMIVPTSFGVCLSKDAQKAIGGSDEQQAIQYTYSLIDDSVKTVPVTDDLIRHNSEYIYFNTDHHWTQLGAYYAYRDFCAEKGITPHKITDYEKISYPDFIGTYYEYSNQAQALADNPDTVDCYLPIGTNDDTLNDMNGDYASHVICDVSDVSNKYMTFLGGDHALAVITNPAVTDGSACVLIKESFGNCFAPFLVDHYQTVYVVDYRYYTASVNDLIREKGISDVIFLNNAEALLKSNADLMLGLFPG